MRTLKRSINKAEVGGEPLPPAFAAFERAGIILRRAEITMIAGAPGAGKSSIALAIAARAKVPTLYFSADTNAHTMAMRLLAMSSRITQTAAEQMPIQCSITQMRPPTGYTTPASFSFTARSNRCSTAS